MWVYLMSRKMVTPPEHLVSLPVVVNCKCNFAFDRSVIRISLWRLALCA